MGVQYLTLFILFFSFIQPIEGNEKKDDAEVNEAVIPNPLELKKSWWDYFNVPPEQFSVNLDKFKVQLEKFLEFSTKESHEEIIKEKEDVFINLELLYNKKNKIKIQEDPYLQILKEYSPEQILQVNQTLSEVQNRISQMHDKVVFYRNRLGRIQSDLDKQIMRYYDLPNSSYEKLLAGLQIIDKRVELAIHKSEIDTLVERINYNTQEKKLLIDELKNARTKISYASLDPEKLINQRQDLQKNIDDSKKLLEKLEKQSFQRSELKNELFCCLLDYQIISETIRVENLNLLTLINEVNQILYDNVHDGVNAAVVRESLKKWNKILSNSEQVYQQWQKHLEMDHVQISKMIAEKLKENKEAIILDDKVISTIHLEIDQAFALMEEIQINISGAQQLIKLVENSFFEEKSISETLSIRAKTSWSQFVDSIQEKYNYTVFYLKEHPVTIGTLLKAVLTLVFAVLFSKYLRNMLSKGVFVSKRFSKSSKYILFRLIHYVILIVGFLIALSIIGVDMTNITIVAGALGVGIGFGLQSVVNNIIAGFTLLFNRYIKVGDIVQLKGDVFATVSAINLQFTHVCTFDGADLIIPNSELSVCGLTNWTMLNTYRRFKIPFGVAYGTDKELLSSVILKAVREQPYVLRGNTHYSDPQIWFTRYGDSSMEFELVAWVNLSSPAPNGTATSSLLWVIDNVLNEEGIEIPFAQQDLYIKELPGFKSGGPSVS